MYTNLKNDARDESRQMSSTRKIVLGLIVLGMVLMIGVAVAKIGKTQEKELGGALDGTLGADMSVPLGSVMGDEVDPKKPVVVPDLYNWYNLPINVCLSFRATFNSPVPSGFLNVCPFYASQEKYYNDINKGFTSNNSCDEHRMWYNAHQREYYRATAAYHGCGLGGRTTPKWYDYYRALEAEAASRENWMAYLSCKYYNGQCDTHTAYYNNKATAYRMCWQYHVTTNRQYLQFFYDKMTLANKNQPTTICI